MYINYNTRNTTQHHNSTHAHSKEQEEKKPKSFRSSRTTRIWALISPFPSRQPQFTLAHLARVFSFS